MAIDLDGTLVLAGAGNMGGALLAGWLDAGLSPARVRIQDPAPPPTIAALLARHGIRAEANVALTAPPAAIVAAVKPQIMDQVFPALARMAGPDTVTLSIAAGRTMASFAAHLPAGAAVVRAMPNTPASIGRGITAAVANVRVTAAQRALCTSLLSSVGTVVWLDDEALIDPATAVSGSGPAYVFLLAESLAAAGVAAGLPADVSAALAQATVAGAGEMLHRSGQSPEALRKAVTSPNGTTHAALQVLMRPGRDGLDALIAEAVAAATRRARELAAG
jgi:pyrroline-5-carboxylate reductase